MTLALPIVDLGAPLAPARPRAVCTDCGVSRTRWAGHCGVACQFIDPRYATLERQVHGRARRISSDELFFGPMQAMLRARLATPRRGAQWTGLTTRLAERLLETGRVDAVIATASAHDDRWAPRPIVATTSHELAECRGMKMGFSPIVAMVERAIDAGHRRLAIVGVACQVHAIRALQDRFGLDVVYVIGTPCSDNTTTAHFHHFLSLLTPTPERVQYLEFMPDYEVELRFDDGTTRRIPFMQLPLRDLPADFFPDGCRTCFDYTNALSDITVGYMGGSGDQWIMVRNTRGGELLDLLRDELVVRPVESRGHRAAAVRTFVAALRRAGSGLPLRRAPRWARPIIGWMQRTFGPRGLEFARTRVEMKAAEGVLTLTRERPRRLGRAVPDFVWTLVAPYGITPPGLSGNRSRS